MPSGILRSGAAPAPTHMLLIAVVLVGAAFALSQGITTVSLRYALVVVSALVLFGVAFVRTDFGIYLVIFSMLLSPEFVAGPSGESQRAAITLRTEDLTLIVIGLSWFAKTAVNKEMGLVTKTPLNRPIMAYVLASLFATLVGYVTGTVRTQSGFFYVLKYVEYFFVYYMVVNNVTDRRQAWRLVTAAFVTAAIVSLLGAAQVPSGERVSAPFEGEVGEPNTFGGYLLLMMAIAGGIAFETRRLRMRFRMLALLALMVVPFVFTLSRASYLGLIPAFFALLWLSDRRRLAAGLVLVAVVLSPVVIAILPKPVVKRVLYTFEPERGQPTVRLGRVGLDPSTSARLLSVEDALKGWIRRPILGYGVTGFRFMDAQYARTLVETGVVGMAAFVWLMWSVIRSARAAFKRLDDPEERGLVLGFMAGTVGLLVHAIGSNTFIIVRIMEPFWFFAGIVVMLPVVADRGARREPPPVAARRPLPRPA